MSAILRVIALPDAVAVSSASILQMCLYFDEVYLEAFEPRIMPSSNGQTGKELRLQLKRPRLDAWLKPLREAGIVRRTSGARIFRDAALPALNSFSSRELPPTLREAVARSLENGADLLTTILLCLPKNRAVRMQLPYSPSFPDPLDLGNSEFELAICTHIASIVAILGISQNNSLIPFTSHRSHAHLLTAITNAFPPVAKALGLEDSELLSIRHAALAQAILEETLPAIRVRAPEDILELREVLNDELLRFRTELGRLAATLTTSPAGDPFGAQIQTLLAKEVRPAIADLHRRLAKPSQRLVKHLVSDWTTIASGSAFPLAAILMHGAQLPWAILGGLSAGLGLAALRAKVEEWSAKRDSAFTFLIEAERRLR